MKVLQKGLESALALEGGLPSMTRHPCKTVITVCICKVYGQQIVLAKPRVRGMLCSREEEGEGRLPRDAAVMNGTWGTYKMISAIWARVGSRGAATGNRGVWNWWDM